MSAVTLSVFLTHYNAELTLTLPDTLPPHGVVITADADTGDECVGDSPLSSPQYEDGVISEVADIP
ncbi:TPA: hypothetical protein ACTU99_004958 [Escherichia coli]